MCRSVGPPFGHSGATLCTRSARRGRRRTDLVHKVTDRDDGCPAGGPDSWTGQPDIPSTWWVGVHLGHQPMKWPLATGPRRHSAARGTESGGVGQGIACLSPPRPVPGDQPWTDPCKNKPAGAARPSLGTPPACPASAHPPRCPPRHRLRSRPAPGRRSPTRRADELGFSGRPARPSGCHPSARSVTLCTRSVRRGRRRTDLVHKVVPAVARTGPTETTEEPQIPPRSTSGPRRTSQQLVTAFPGGVASRDGPSV